MKNRMDRLVVLNRIALAVVNELRGTHPDYVFTHKGKALSRMYNRAWKQARIRAGLPQARIRDLNKRSVADCVLPGYRSRIAKTCWGTSPVGSPPTTPRLSCHS